jgi:hypothetical protein
MSKADRLAVAPQIFGDQHKIAFEQQELCIQTLPLVKLTMTAFVQGEEEIVVGDILTCKLVARRQFYVDHRKFVGLLQVYQLLT